MVAVLLQRIASESFQLLYCYDVGHLGIIVHEFALQCCIRCPDIACALPKSPHSS